MKAFCRHAEETARIRVECSLIHAQQSVLNIFKRLMVFHIKQMLPPLSLEFAFAHFMYGYATSVSGTKVCLIDWALAHLSM